MDDELVMSVLNGLPTPEINQAQNKPAMTESDGKLILQDLLNSSQAGENYQQTKQQPTLAHSENGAYRHILSSYIIHVS